MAGLTRNIFFTTLYMANPIIPVGIKAAIIFLLRFQFFNIISRYKKTTAAMAPNWIDISNVFKNSVSAIFNRWEVSIRWAVEDIGRNSVKPSTTPRIMDWIMDIRIPYYMLFLSKIKSRYKEVRDFDNLFIGLCVNSATHGLTDNSFPKEKIENWINFLEYFVNIKHI